MALEQGSSAQQVPHLPDDLQDRIYSYLPPNDIACSVRAVNKRLRTHFSACKTVRLSQPVPSYAFKFVEASPIWSTLTLQKRLKVLCLTAASGDLQNLQLAIRCAGCLELAGVLEGAAAAGHLHICQWLFHPGGLCWRFRGHSGVLAAAAGAGHRALCEWLLSSGAALDTDVLLAAARGGHVDIMDWLLARSFVCVKYSRTHYAQLLQAVAEGCDLATLQRLFQSWQDLQQRRVARGAAQQPELFTEMERTTLVDTAAGSLLPDWRAKVQWLQEQFGAATLQRVRCEAAARRPDAVERLPWLRQLGCRADERTVAAAARSGNVDALRYLLNEMHAPTNSDVACSAAEGGHVEVLRVLHSRGGVDRPVVALAAARGGHQPVMAFLVEVGLDPTTLSGPCMAAAVRSGSVELLTLLRERGCVFGQWAWTQAAVSGSGAVLQWLPQQGIQPPDDGRPYDAAASAGDLATMGCLRGLGCPWGATTALATTAAMPSPLPALRWLLDESCPVDWQAAIDAVADGPDQQEVLGWLRAEQQQRQQQVEEQV